MANRVFTRGQRMSKSWSLIPAISLSLTADGTTLAGRFTPGEPATILRMIGDYSLASTAVAVSQDRCFISMGIGVISADAFEAGAGSVPDPQSEPEYPWLYWASHPLHWPTAVSGTAGDGDQSGQGSLRVRFDIKSMRKMKPRESLAMIWQYADSTGTPPVRALIGTTRVLVAT